MMQPQPDKYTIQLPVTFDYKGGRGENSKNKIIATVVIIILTIPFFCVVAFNDGLELWQRVVYSLAVLWLSLLLIRYLAFNELHFSDLYECLLETDFELDYSDYWKIFDIDTTYPYICFFKNGLKGIFVQMEKDAVTGKPDSAVYDHYEAIGDAYNVAHTLNMDIVHVDYMDNIGNDSRLLELTEKLGDVYNPEMQVLLYTLYDHLAKEMSSNYASYDVYLYLSREDKSNFLRNVQAVASTMLGGNFITYKIADRTDIGTMCKGLLNLESFSVIDACDSVIENEIVGGIRPISIKHSDGSIEVLNKTIAEKDTERREAARKANEAKEEKLKNRHAERRKKREAKKNRGKKGNSEQLFDDNEEIDLF